MKKKFNYRQLSGLIVALIVMSVVAYGIDFYGHARVAKKLVSESVRFEHINPNADKRILVIGDSTAVGTGVEDPLDSVAGRFHLDFPEAEIINLAVNGAKAEDIIEQAKAAEGEYDLAVVHSGANDILYFTPIRELLNNTRELLRITKTKSKIVVLSTSGDFGKVPAFTPPTDWLYSIRSIDILEKIQDVAAEEGVLFVDFLEYDFDSLPEGYEFYAAPDFLHFNGEGYGIWYKEIRKTMSEAGVDGV